MNNEQRSGLITAIMLAAAGIIIVNGWLYFSTAKEPVESTWRRVLSCTVKSNIDGVITLNDDCKITVIGE